MLPTLRRLMYLPEEKYKKFYAKTLYHIRAPKVNQNNSSRLGVIFILKRGNIMPIAKKLPSGSWRCQVFSHYESIVQPDGSIKKKRIYESFTSNDPSKAGKREAEAMAAVFAEHKEQRSISKSRMTFAEALNSYIEERSSVLSPATIRKYKSSQRNRFALLNDMKLKDINQDVVQNYINAIALTLSPKTVRDLNGLVTAVMNRFAPETILKVTLPKKVRPDLYIPSEDDIKRLLSSVKNTNMEVPVMLAAFGTMRRGEISALTKADVSGNVIHVSKTMVLDEKNKWIVKAPKSYAGDRFVVLPQFVIDSFMALPGNGVGMTPNKISSRFEHILKGAGLEHFRFHDLRHYSASIQHALGIPDAYIMQTGGWGNDRVLKEVYRHTLSETREKMSNIAVSYFETMQHEMQHEKEKAQ